MKLIFTVDSEGKGYVAALESAIPGEGGEHRKAADVGKGQRIELDLPDLVSADQIGFGNVTDSESGDVVTETPGNTEGQTPAAGEGEQGDGGQSAEPASTSAASEKPLYLIDGDKAAGFTNAGFEPSGLETPDGKALYHYAGDTAGQSATGNADGVSVYADADDNEKPVQPATPAGEQG